MSNCMLKGVTVSSFFLKSKVSFYKERKGNLTEISFMLVSAKAHLALNSCPTLFIDAVVASFLCILTLVWCSKFEWLRTVLKSINN